MGEVVQYNGKITRFVVLSCVIAALGGLIFDYGPGVTGGVASMGSFLEKFFPGIYRKMNGKRETNNYCKFDSQLLTFFTSSLFISGLVATFLASPVTRAWGRKASILIGGAAFIAGSALGGAAENIYMLIFSRLLLGIGCGFANQNGFNSHNSPNVVVSARSGLKCILVSKLRSSRVFLLNFVEQHFDLISS
ncbi:UNVERIFIED_CONTAM: Hexose carrier protein HEX6 [Sesamum latifolium]|uniref:Hexose carrier protein HEX6 n=1 Tax=Sesamum latifolium TaxID=2727402 RepID=A0AAW2T7W8_9LAMI